ncbi:MAG: C39 family peptidase [Candidatus Thiodiazotropha sp.]
MKHILLIFLLTFPVLVNAKDDEVVILDVPVVKQGRALCGPATIEMVFRYWGITDYDQYDIAYNILLFNPNVKRVKNSKILQSKVINWKLYPGTGTSTMRDFLKQLSTTKNHKFKSISTDYKYSEKQKKRIWGIVKGYLSNDIPVIVHQYCKGK